MKKTNTNTESVLGKMLLLTFLLGLFLLFSENHIGANTNRQYTKVVSEISVSYYHAEIGADSKTISFNAYLIPVDEVNYVLVNKYHQIQIFIHRIITVQFKAVRDKFDDFKSNIFCQLIKFIQLRIKSQDSSLIY